MIALAIPNCVSKNLAREHCVKDRSINPLCFKIVSWPTKIGFVHPSSKARPQWHRFRPGFAMEYRGKHYVIFEDENSKAWIWAVPLDDDTTKTGETASRGEAITKVVLAVDQAMSTARRGQSIAF
jgi:hypothetical protein